MVLSSGDEKRVPVDSENIRPRLFALPGRAASSAGDEPQAEARGRVDFAARTGADGTLKVGSKVTIEYTMSAKSIESKGSPAKPK